MYLAGAGYAADESSRSFGRAKSAVLRMTTLGAPLPGSHVPGAADRAWPFLFASAMISALLTETKPAALLVALSLVLSIFAPALSRRVGGRRQVPPALVFRLSSRRTTSTGARWFLIFPPHQHYPQSRVSRPCCKTRECFAPMSRSRFGRNARLDKRLCVAKDVLTLQEEVSKRIDGIIREGMVHQHKSDGRGLPLDAALSVL